MKAITLSLLLLGLFTFRHAELSAAASTADVIHIDGNWQGAVGGTNVNIVNTPITDTIRWGTFPVGGSQSRYSFTPAMTSPFVVSMYEPFIYGIFTHGNFPILSGTSITSANMKLDFGLEIDSVPFLTTFDMTFLHNETPNTNPNPNDIVTMNPNTLVSGATVINGQSYFIEVLGFQLPGGSIVQQIQTIENGSSSFPLVARITTPEPHAYLILGSLLAGMTCLSLVRKKRKPTH